MRDNTFTSPKTCTMVAKVCTVVAKTCPTFTGRYRGIAEFAGTPQAGNFGVAGPQNQVIFNAMPDISHLAVVADDVFVLCTFAML